MTKNWFLLLLVAACLQLSSANVKILAPDRLKADVQYKISTFGLVDYQAGKTIDILLWNSDDGCDPPTDDILQLGRDVGFLMKKGSCSYRRQAVNGRRAGAYLVLVYSDAEDHALETPSSDEDVRDLELPPVIMISKKNGENIRGALSKGEQVRMFFDWEINIYEPPVNVELVYSVVDYKSISIYQKLISFQLESALNDKPEQVSNLIKLLAVPKFYQRNDFNLTTSDSSKYCVDNSDICVNPHPSVSLTKPLDEVVVAGFLYCLQVDIEKGVKLQNFLFMEKLLKNYAELLRIELDSGKTLNLTQHFDQSLKSEDIEELNHGKKSFISGVLSCLKHNFGQDMANLKPNYALMQKLLKEGSQRKTKIPVMFIEKHLVRGDLTPMTAISAVCDVLPMKVRPLQCSGVEASLSKLTEKLTSKDNLEGNLSIGKRLLYTFIVSFLMFGFMYFICSALLQRRLQKDIAKDIDQSLEQYYQIQNTRLEIVPRDTELKADHS